MSIFITNNRRAFLKTSQVCLALPLFDSLLSASSKTTKIKRMVFFGQGYGFTKQTFYPQKEGKFSEIGLTPGLKPLSRYKNDITFVSNLTNRGATDAHGGSTSYLTGANVKGTPGKKFYNSISLDQVAARMIGKDTRYASLALSSKSSKDGHGTGLSLSWNEKGLPIPGICSAMELYDTLFGQSRESKEERAFRFSNKQSILDGVMIDAKAIKPKLSQLDQHKLNDYFESVRQIELSLLREKDWSNRPKPKTNLRRPKETMDAIEELKTMHALMVAALQTDSTRVITYRMPVGTIMESAGFSLTPHSLSHYNLSPERGKASEKKDVLFMELFASFLDKLKAARDLEGKSLFESTLVSYGTNLRSGHELRNLPTIVTGRGAKGIKYGEHIAMPKTDTPLCNYWLTLMQQTGLSLDKFGHSDGILPELLT